MSLTLKMVEKDIQATKDHLIYLDNIKKEFLSRKFYTCPHCSKKTQIKKLLYFKNNYYVNPYSCNGGGYWQRAGVDYILCNKCTYVERIAGPKNQYLTTLASNFKAILDSYDHEFQKALDKYNNDNK